MSQLMEHTGLIWFAMYGIGCICGMAAALALVKMTRCDNCCMKTGGE